MEMAVTLIAKSKWGLTANQLIQKVMDLIYATVDLGCNVLSGRLSGKSLRLSSEPT